MCVFPGCRMPARDSDLDHTLDYAKGGRDPPPQPWTPVPPPPPLEASSGMETRTTHTRHVHLDKPTRAHLSLTGPSPVRPLTVPDRAILPSDVCLTSGLPSVRLPSSVWDSGSDPLGCVTRHNRRHEHRSGVPLLARPLWRGAGTDHRVGRAAAGRGSRRLAGRPRSHRPRTDAPGGVHDHRPRQSLQRARCSRPRRARPGSTCPRWCRPGPCPRTVDAARLVVGSGGHRFR